MNKEKIYTAVNRMHQLIIGGDAGDDTKRFIKNISVSFVGGLGAFAILFVASVVAARFLGPTEYGKYAVLFSLAQLLSLAFVLELDVSALYFFAGAQTKKKDIAGSIMMMFIINVIAFSFLAVSIYHFFDFSHMSYVAFVGALIMAYTFALKRLIDAFLRADDRFGVQSILRSIEALSVLISIVVVFYGLSYHVYYGYALSIIFGGIVFSVCGAWFVRQYIGRPRWHGVQINEIFRYNIYGMINAFVNGMIKNADKILVATFLGVSVAGVYAVYFTASVIVGARITQIFMNVFFPTARSNTKKIHAMYTKINRFFVRLSIPLIVCASGGVALIVWTYGSQYPFVWTWIVCGGVYIVVHFFASLYGMLLSSMSQNGYKLYNVSFLYGAIAYVVVLFFALMINAVSIVTFLCALILYRSVSGIYSFCSVRRHINLRD